MRLTPEQVKGRIKNVAKMNKADARTLMRIYMMERFLERIASSKYKDNFIIKGGMLVTAMVGVWNINLLLERGSYLTSLLKMDVSISFLVMKVVYNKPYIVP